MALKQQQQLKQQQKLSPLQIQVIRLTELPTLEFEERVKQELEDNPALDEGLEHGEDELLGTAEDDTNISQEDLAKGDYFSEEEMPDYHIPSYSSSKTQAADFSSSGAASMQEFLLRQLNEMPLNDRQLDIARYIIGSIDDSGYLDRTLQAISDDLLFQQNIDVPTSELEEVLHIVQALEPSGIAARNLQECLLLQLKQRNQTETIKHAITIIQDYFEEYSKKHYDKILRALSIDEEELKRVNHEIVSLNPKPGNYWSDSITQSLNTITPDFIVDSYNGELYFSLNNRNIPPLKVNREFSDLLQGYSDNKESMSTDNKNAALYVKQKVDAARWFIDAVRQRQQTMERTMEVILRMQYQFFLTGDEADLKPMILKDVADATGYDISTISRVSNSKYVQTHLKIYPLKYFFSESMTTDSGEEISSREIKKILEDCISHEDKRKPLTDDKLTDLLNSKGYQIARRTVSKYREQLNIPIARLRKEI